MLDDAELLVAVVAAVALYSLLASKESLEREPLSISSTSRSFCWMGHSKMAATGCCPTNDDDGLCDDVVLETGDGVDDFVPRAVVNLALISARREYVTSSGWLVVLMMIPKVSSSLLWW
jgi:hypothetical protein